MVGSNVVRKEKYGSFSKKASYNTCYKKLADFRQACYFLNISNSNNGLLPIMIGEFKLN